MMIIMMMDDDAVEMLECAGVVEDAGGDGP